ncbi:inversin-like [Seriola lalandi dorsalis]|nr:inversin-like [Seriola lalandi dorsalis]
MRFLLECNAKLNKKDHYGNTPLIHACLCGNLETVNTLLQSNALVNMANLQGNTALHEAVRGGHQALVELLLRGGASPGLRNKRQRTPLDCAYELGGKNTEILRALQKASGLSPDAEPIKLLSVPKGALAHSFVQRLRLQDHSNGRKQKLAQSISRIQQMKKGSSGPSPRCSPTLNQVNPDRRRLRRGETVEVSSPSGSLESGPRLRERPLGRCHTLDSGERAPERLQAKHAPDTSDDAQPDVNETHSADDSSCSSGSKTSPSPPPSSASPQADNSFEAPPTHVLTNHSASHETDLPVNGPCDQQNHADDAESSQSDGKDGNSNPTRPADLPLLVQTGGGDPTHTDHTPETSAERRRGNGDVVEESCGATTQTP